MRFEELTSECAVLVHRHMEKKQNDKRGYNIYKILHVTNNEVLMCRVLADLLSPNGSHGMGSVFLQVFLKNILEMDVSDEALQEAHIYKEYPIMNDRRIDLVIRLKFVFIPIEVKINAGEQKSQCYDYFQFAKKSNADTFVVYLTKFGHFPSEYSTYGGIDNKDFVPKNKIRCISFSGDIIDWLNNIWEISSEKLKPMIMQYIDAIKDFTENKDEEYRMEIVEKINQGSDTLRTSIEIAKALDDAKAAQIYKLFQEFERQMPELTEKYGLEEESVSRWFHYREQANRDFYAHNESTYPGLNYIVKGTTLGKGLSLWLRIEVNYRLFACFCVFNYDLESEFGKGNQQDIISQKLWDKLRDYVELPDRQTEKSWVIDWKYLPTGSSSIMDDIESIPDFKKMNEAAISLAGDEERRIFVRKCIKTIENALLSELR